jgi:hypothetical protein
VELLENPAPHFGDKLLEDRSQVERYFGGLVSWGGGLAGLPAWVRTHRRVQRWVQAKLVLTASSGSSPKRLAPLDEKSWPAREAGRIPRWRFGLRRGRAQLPAPLRALICSSSLRTSLSTLANRGG